MGPAECEVVGSYNSMKKLKKLRESNCEIHDVLMKDCVYVYNPPYRNFKLVFSELERKEKNG